MYGVEAFLLPFLWRGSVRCTEWERSSSHFYGEVPFDVRSDFQPKNIPQLAIMRTPHLARSLFSRGKSDLRRNCVPEFEHAN